MWTRLEQGVGMTTQTETLESVHLFLAARLPELQRECPNHDNRGRGFPCFCDQEEGWVPNVTTDGLLEALATKGWRNVTYTFEVAEEKVVRVVCFIDKSPGAAYKVGEAPTTFEALCRAARKALE